MPEGFNTEVFSYQDRDWEKPVNHYQKEHLGKNVLDTSVCGFEDRNAYVKDGRIRGGNIVGTGITAYIVLDELGVEHPEIAYDSEADKLLVEEIEDSVPAHKAEGDIDTDSFYRQVASRGILGDRDLYKNVLAYPEEDTTLFVNIDFEDIGFAFDTFMDENGSTIREVAEKTGIDYSPERIYTEAKKLSKDADIEALEIRLEENKFVKQNWASGSLTEDASIENILSNIREAQESLPELTG